MCPTPQEDTYSDTWGSRTLKFASFLRLWPVSTGWRKNVPMHVLSYARRGRARAHVKDSPFLSTPSAFAET